MKSMKVLIAYYSWSGTTKRLSEKLHNLISNSDLLEIKIPAGTFSSDMYQTADIYEKQKAVNALPKVLNIPKNINQYDQILLGSPVWDWGVSSPVMSFMHEIQDFNGKVYPFYTSVGNSQRFMKYFDDCKGKLSIGPDFDDSHDNLNDWMKEVTE